MPAVHAKVGDVLVEKTRGTAASAPVKVVVLFRTAARFSKSLAACVTRSSSTGLRRGDVDTLPGQSGDRRHARRLAEAADRSGISRDGSPADTGADLPTTAKARAAARRDDIREVRDHLTFGPRCGTGPEGAETSLGQARLSMETREAACREAGERLASARAEVTEKLTDWAARWIGDEPYAAITAEQAEELSGALDQIGEPDAPSLTELFGTLTAKRRTALTVQASD